jgi:hypothetical protein
MRPDAAWDPAPAHRAARAAARPSTGHRVVAVLILALILSACTGGFMTGQRPPAPPPVINPTATSSAVLNEDLLLLQKLVQGKPSEQAEIVANAQRDYDMAPTPSHTLKLALILGTPGHPAASFTRAQALLRELMANPEMLLPGERALAFLTLSQIDDHLTLDAENLRLQAEAVRADREHVATANHRLQAEMDENARLRKDLEEARAKLDAIANIERSLNERKPGSSGR